MNEYRRGDILKFDDGVIGIISNGGGVNSSYSEGDRFIYLLCSSHRFEGQIAQGYLERFHRDRFELIGNINNILSEMNNNG